MCSLRSRGGQSQAQRAAEKLGKNEESTRNIRRESRIDILFLCVGGLLALFGWASRSDAASSQFEVSLVPGYGIGNLTSAAINTMNERLGNSPRLDQPYGFGRLDVMGGDLMIWTQKRKYGFGLGVWNSETRLVGTSNFEGVSGAAQLGVLGIEGSATYRLAPSRSLPRQIRRSRLQNLGLYVGVLVGYGQVTFSNAIEDLERNVAISYTYEGQNLIVGGRTFVTWEAASWLRFMLVDLSLRQFIPMGSAVSVKDYLVSGRNEAPLAAIVLQSEFEKTLLLTTVGFGLEISL